jgi:formamidopyrimidine-DNA glycosylase
MDVTVEQLAASFQEHNMRVHGFLRDQHMVAGLGRMLANEVCHRAKLSPFAMTRKLGGDGAAAVVAAIHEAVDEGLAFERTRDTMSSSADRPGRVHNRVGEACPVCADTIRSVSYSGYTVAYCPTCQTGGKVLADNTTSRFLK